MAQHGKKYKESLNKVDREALYALSEAVDLGASRPVLLPVVGHGLSPVLRSPALVSLRP